MYKKISPHKYKKNFCLVNIRMINLSFDELRLVTQIRNISDYENKSKEDLIKALSETKLEPDTSNQNQNLIRVKTDTRKLKKLLMNYDVSFLKKK